MKRRFGRVQGRWQSAPVLVFALSVTVTLATAPEWGAHAAESAADARSASGAAAPPSKQPLAPRIQTLLKENVYQRVREEREIMSYAVLEDAAPDARPAVAEKASDGKKLKKYSFYFSMLARAGMSVSRRVLTDYELYEKMIPMVDHARFDDRTRLLDVQGGVFNYKMRAWVRFEEIGESWIRYEVVRGHFKGMKGDILFEDHADKGTLVYFGGELTGKTWPPAFILERGAEVVFSFVGRKMRSYLESIKRSGSAEATSKEPPGDAAGKGEKKNDGSVPQPRTHF